MAALLNYGEPQILELFKNTLPNKLYWILFPNNNLRDAVDAMKRVLTKEKLDKQLSGQVVATTQFMKVGDNSNSAKKVSYEVQDPIREQLENLTSMVYDMSMERKENRKPFKPQIYQKRGRDRTDRILVIETGVEHLIVADKMLDLIIREDHKLDNVGIIVEEEIRDVKIMVEMIVEIEEDKILEVIMIEAEV